MTQDKKSRYKEVVKSFFLAFKRLSLYSANHPLSKDILKNLFVIFEELLKEHEEVLIVAGANTGEMIINQERLGSDVLGAEEIFERFKTFKVDGISMSRGLLYEELVDFVTAMAKASVVDGGKTVELPILLKDGTKHIKIKKVRYEKVEEGEKVVAQDAILGPGGDGTLLSSVGNISYGGGAPVKDVFLDIKNFLTGKAGDVAKGVDGVFHELDHNVSKVTEIIIESIKESGDFESVIRKFVQWLSKNIAPIVVEKKKDPAKFIQSFFDSFKKDGIVSGTVSNDKVIEECSDEIKMAVIEEALISQKSGMKKVPSAVLKILSDEKDQARIFPQLAGRLIGRGIAPEQAQECVSHIQVELAKDEEVVISKKKLQKLMRISEQFEHELHQRIKDETLELRVQNEHLVLEKERSEGVMHHLAQGLVVVDKNGKVAMMNPAAQKLLGSEAGEVVGKTLVESLKKEHLMALAKGYQAQAGSAITKEIELASKDETTKKILRASSAVVEDEDGKTVGMVSVLSDITHEKEVEEMKSHFVSLVTHELRTPVVTIQKSLELVLGGTTGAINDDQKKFLSVSQMNLTRLNNLINDLLDMSKLEAGRFVLRPTEFDMRDMVGDAKTSLMGWSNDKKVAVHLEFKDAPLHVFADRDRLLQVLINLMSNALKFTPSNGKISIHLEEYENRGDVCQEPCVEVSVEDSGVGIDPKDFKRIFNKFEQVSLVGPSTGMGGTGLGLPIAKEIIGLHGGKIWVESQKDKGSRFIFVIPKKYKDAGKRG